MRLIMLGLSHKTAQVDVREQLARCCNDAEALSRRFADQWQGAELVVISTCNRVELYIARPSHQPPTREQLINWLADRAGLTVEQLAQAMLHFEDEKAAEHLFRVCCGLESMVLGETQILGQVRRAYEQAVTNEAVGTTLHRVFQQAIATAKKVRQETGIGDGRVSVGTVAVDFARQIFERFDDKTVLGIGAGEMAKVMLAHLKGLSPYRLWLTNRSPERAEALAAELGVGAAVGGARPFAELDELLIEADIVLTGTASHDPILTTARIRSILKRRKHRPLFLVDVAVPRDVEAGVNELPNVYLYNIDDLAAVVTDTYQQRQGEIDACEAIVNRSVTACWSEIHHREIGQVIRALRTRLHELGDTETQRTLRKMQAIKPDQLEDRTEALLEEHTRRLINKILHIPLSQMDHRQTESPLTFYSSALRKLFQLPAEMGDADKPSDAQAAHDSAADTENAAPDETHEPGDSAAEQSSRTGSAHV